MQYLSMQVGFLDRIKVEYPYRPCYPPHHIPYGPIQSGEQVEQISISKLVYRISEVVMVMVV